MDSLRKGMVVEKVSPIFIMTAEALTKEGLKEMTPQETIKNFLIAGFAGDSEKLTWFFGEQWEPTDQISTHDFAQIADCEEIKLVDVYSDGNYAFVATSRIKTKSDSGMDDEGQIIFILSKQSGTWLIEDGDNTSVRSADGYIKSFIEKHPNAKSMIDSEISIIDN